mmetsp:Transcript_5277/g.7767  ORF Transcript_5277/g.7767 Transcript_5277/m.7767 type:complete len:855 (+) Transcript_5277:61-2625(+)
MANPNGRDVPLQPSYPSPEYAIPPRHYQMNQLHKMAQLGARGYMAQPLPMSTQAYAQQVYQAIPSNMLANAYMANNQYQSVHPSYVQKPRIQPAVQTATQSYPLSYPHHPQVPQRHQINRTLQTYQKDQRAAAELLSFHQQAGNLTQSSSTNYGTPIQTYALNNSQTTSSIQRMNSVSNSVMNEKSSRETKPTHQFDNKSEHSGQFYKDYRSLQYPPFSSRTGDIGNDSDSDYEPGINSRSSRRKQRDKQRDLRRVDDRATRKSSRIAGGPATKKYKLDGTISKRTISPEDAMGILDKLWEAEDDFYWFHEPVDEKEAENYYEIIKEPMDLSTLKNMVKHEKIPTFKALFSKLQQITSNCRRYNGEESMISQIADRLEKMSRDLLVQLAEEQDRESELSLKFISVLRNLKRSPETKPFRKAVDLEEFPDYATIVKRPVDLHTIEENCKIGKYEKLEDFARDVRLLRENCILYHGRDKGISALANSTWRRFMELMRDAFSNISRETLLKSEESKQSKSNAAKKFVAPLPPPPAADGEEKTSRKRKSMAQSDDSHSKRNIQTHTLEDLESNWKWAVVTMWCETFGKFVFPEKNFHFNPKALQVSLMREADSSNTFELDYAENLAMIMLQIYKDGSKMKIDEFSWENELVRQLDRHRIECGIKDEEPVPVSRRDFRDLYMLEKLDIIRWIGDWCLSEISRFQNLVVYDNNKPPFENEPLGSDGQFTYYHFVPEENMEVSIYREYAPKENIKSVKKSKQEEEMDFEDEYEWKLIVTNLDEARLLRENFDALKPKTKTGRHRIGQIKGALESEVIEVLERRQKQIEVQKRQSKKLGVDTKNIMERPRKRSKTRKYGEES